MAISNTQILTRLLVAVLIGFLFGLERNRRAKPVGRRTHVLVCLSCTMISMISAYAFMGQEAEGFVSDPARLMVGVLTGIGFICGGLIWQSKSGSIHGITTAADIFLLAALGIAIGLRLYILVAMSAAIGLLALAGGNFLRRGRGGDLES